MIDILLDLSMNAKINNTDQILVKYFLNQREKLIELSLEDVIYDTGLSKSSIIRFCKSIKTSHFTDFKKTFVREFNAVICDFIYLLDDRDKLDLWISPRYDTIHYFWATYLDTIHMFFLVIIIYHNASIN